MSFSLRRCCFLMSVVMGLSIGLPTETIAADNIVVKYGWLNESISVEELKTFSETGETSPKLDFYLQASKQNPNKVRRMLNKPIPVDGVMLSEVLNNRFGGMILNSFSDIITTPSKRASKESLRGALVTSALDNNDISIMEVLENYPTSEVHLQGDRLADTYEQIESILKVLK